MNEITYEKAKVFLKVIEDVLNKPYPIRRRDYNLSEEDAQTLTELLNDKGCPKTLQELKEVVNMKSEEQRMNVDIRDEMIDVMLGRKHFTITPSRKTLTDIRGVEIECGDTVLVAYYNHDKSRCSMEISVVEAISTTRNEVYLADDGEPIPLDKFEVCIVPEHYKEW